MKYYIYYKKTIHLFIIIFLYSSLSSSTHGTTPPPVWNSYEKKNQKTNNHTLNQPQHKHKHKPSNPKSATQTQTHHPHGRENKIAEREGWIKVTVGTKLNTKEAVVGGRGFSKMGWRGG